MKSYRDLVIYQESQRLAVAVHQMSLALPKFELYEEGGQIRRSSKSVTAMIVEGYGRKRYKADFVKYLVFSQAECDETIVHLDFLFKTGSLTREDLYMTFKNGYEDLSRKINRFIHWVDQYWNQTPNHKTE